MFGFTKVVKLMGLFLRNPSDVVFLPISIVFGYLHGFIKLYTLFTHRMVGFLTLFRLMSGTMQPANFLFPPDILGQPRRRRYQRQPSSCTSASPQSQSADTSENRRRAAAARGAAHPALLDACETTAPDATRPPTAISVARRI